MISFAYMGKPQHNRTITAADRQAARRLKALWLAMPRDQRPTQQQLGELWEGPTEGSQSLISQYMNEKIALNYRAVLFFAKHLRCDPTQIRADLPEQAMSGGTNFDLPYTDVTGFAQAVGLGAGAEAQEYAETHSLKFKTSSLRKRGILGGKLSVYYGKGDSMQPTIKDGDAILFDEADTRILDGRLYVVQAGKEIYVKRAEVLDDTVYFRSDNPSGDHNWVKPRRMDNKKSPIHVIGRVHWIGAWAD